MNASTAARVLVVEDDPKIAALLIDYLHAAGHEAQAQADGALALGQIEADAPDLLLLDLMLPGLDGVALCSAVRAFSDLPIIMLTARVDEVDRLLGLNIGADDYVCKPFSPRELMARVQAQLRRSQGRLRQQTLPWQIDDERLQISWRQQGLKLTLLEFRMLRLMLNQPGRVLSRAQLLDSLHADQRDVSDRVIDSHIKNIRRKIEAADPGCDCIVSVYGVGYCVDTPNAPA